MDKSGAEIDQKIFSPKYTVDIRNIQPIPESKKEIELDIPNFRFGPEGSVYNEQAISECKRVAAEVLKYLRVDQNEKFKLNLHPFSLVDVNVTNEQGLKTFPRTELGLKNLDLPIIVFSEAPVYDIHGNLQIAIYSQENAIIFISFNKLIEQFTRSESSTIAKPGDIVLKPEATTDIFSAGIATIEEVIHFVQMVYWGESSVHGTSSTMTALEHDSDPIEAEARIIKNQLIKYIYPELVLREVSEDLSVELKYRVESAAQNARLIGAEDLKLKEDMEKQRVDMDTLETMTLEFVDTQYNVFVDNPEDYKALIMLSLRQVLIVNYGLTDEELDSEEYQEFYKDWYEENLTHHYDHEMGHYFGALNNSTLKCRLGVEFTRDEDGNVNFFPCIDFEGNVPSKVYREKILMGPDNLSKGDKIAAGIE